MLCTHGTSRGHGRAALSLDDADRQACLDGLGEACTRMQWVCSPSCLMTNHDHMEGFDPIFNEVIFLDMQPVERRFEPLVGYIILEQSRAAVDMVGHRLMPVQYMDLK